MAAPKELDPTTSLAALIGAKVRKHRQRVGWTQRELGDRVHVVHNRIAQIELATDPPTRDLCLALDVALEAGGDITDLWDHMAREMAREAFPDWVRKYMFLESKATKMYKYTAHIVPGLLQTEAYARAMLRAGLPFASDDQIEEKVAARMARQELLRRVNPPHLWAILDEAVIRRPVGGPQAMHDQLAHIVEAAQTPHVTLQVLPFDLGAYEILGGSLMLLSFADRPDVAYLENINSGVLVESADQVTDYSLAYDLVQVRALPPDAALAFLKTAMEDLSHAHVTTRPEQRDMAQVHTKQQHGR